jgi:hypothetical protein
MLLDHAWSQEELAGTSLEELWWPPSISFYLYETESLKLRWNQRQNLAILQLVAFVEMRDCQE